MSLATVSNTTAQLAKLRDQHRELKRVRQPTPEIKKRKLLCKDGAAALEAELRAKGVIK